jgi:hypothetical protein
MPPKCDDRQLKSEMGDYREVTLAAKATGFCISDNRNNLILSASALGTHSDHSM